MLLRARGSFLGLLRAKGNAIATTFNLRITVLKVCPHQTTIRPLQWRNINAAGRFKGNRGKHAANNHCMCKRKGKNGRGSAEPEQDEIDLTTMMSWEITWLE